MRNFCFFKIVCVYLVSYSFLTCQNVKTEPNNIRANSTAPSLAQIEYQKMEIIGFVHFTTNTFTNKEWGNGDESPKVFNPTSLDIEQWVLSAKKGGIQQLILTAKHHDGFCLWPSKFTDHSIKNSPYKNGQGDLVKEFVSACKKHGLKVGLYLSPWDRNHKDYGKPNYLTYYRNQLKELLTNYGEINEIWFDGANGGDGYYGGSNEMRKIDSKTYYNWNELFSLVKELQPNIKIFSDAGPDVRWVGNEDGHAGKTFWSTINKEQITIGKSDPTYLNQGEEQGKNWLIGQCDVSIRPGWFYHKDEDSLVKSTNELFDIYTKSVGRNAVLLLNIPPDPRGLFHEKDVRILTLFKNKIDATFSNNLTKDATVTATNQRLDHPKFSPENILDSKKLSSYWATNDSLKSASVIIHFNETKTFNYVVIQEPIQFGQRVSSFSLEAFENNRWTKISEGTTIGYKRILNFTPVKASKLKLNIHKANNTIAISNVEIYHSK